MPLSNYANGTGNITVSNTANTVTGSATTFLTQFKPGSVIANVSNVYIGHVVSIASNVSLTLRSNANISVSNAAFHYASWYANATVYNYNTVGNITAYTANNVVTGIGTTFNNSHNVGDTLYVVNAAANGANVYIGAVEMVVSNNLLYLGANSIANVSNLQYFRSDYVNVNNTGLYGPGRALDEPNVVVGLGKINSSLYNWTISGLIPNISVVNTYHPPVIDSVTGVLVNIPATIYTNTGNSNASILNTYTHGKQYQESGSQFLIKHFDNENRAFGTDINNVQNNLHNGYNIRRLIDTNDQNAFNNSISTLVSGTSSDSFAKLIGANVPRVTDNFHDAKAYFGEVGPTTALLGSGTNLGENQDKKLRKPPMGLKKLVPTGAPIAIPGLLNAVADTYEPSDNTWVIPQYKPTNVK
jgi:hypothetical protein